MSPEDRLRKIVAAAKGDGLERMERAIEADRRCGGEVHAEMDGPYLRRLRKERAEWQAAADLLERLLAGGARIAELEAELAAVEANRNELWVASLETDGDGGAT
jgi:uncharacterized protein involved in exopolysaccharide biosynthesis